ncbi:MAG: long-chain fatty acid--CoA ligase [bacterium]|nr:long-chain fatty acid--CoA ligase [bacterium]MCP4964486.1 long-chain fatty acid--CoA ligase [bacterium]
MTATVERVDSSGAASSVKTVASRVRDWAESDPQGTAMREKDFGIWQEYGWSKLWDEIVTAGHGLLALGVDVGDVVSIHSEDRPEWVILDLATVAIRGITTGLYPTNPMAEVKYLLNDSGARVHFAEDQEQVDKVLEAEPDAFPTVTSILFVEPRGLRSYGDDRLMFWDDFMEMGRDHRKANPGAVEALMAAAEPDDVITLVYTSGTTGPPKGAMLNNKNATFAIDKIVMAEGRTRDGKSPHPDDQVLTYLPLCHVAERIFSTWHMVGAGVTLNFAESIETVQVNLREIQPTLFFAVPRIWEKIHATILIKLNDASRIKRVFNGIGLKLAGFIAADRTANKGNFTWKSRLAYAIGNPLMFRALKERVGLRRCRWAGTGAAAIAPEVLQFFMGFGVPVYELYGMTENSAVATLNHHGRVKVGTVGEPYSDIGLRLDEESGEIQTKHDGVFAGYWRLPEKTAETMTDDGWLKTGDVGVWVEDTHIKIVDRIKHIIITSGGKNISPSEIENSLKTSPYIKEAMVIGEGRKYLTALIGIELDTVGMWALRQSIPYTTYRDLSEKPEVIQMVQRLVDETNAKFARVEQIKKFRMIPKELDHEDGELTATQKVKRGAMFEMFEDLVEDLYR